VLCVTLLLFVVLVPPELAGQEVGPLQLRTPDGQVRPVRVKRDQGFAAVWVGALTAWGWDVDARADSAVAHHPAGSRLLFRAESPYAYHDDLMVQLAHPPYMDGAALFVPLQVLSEFGTPAEVVEAPTEEAGERSAASPGRPVRVVVVDAGHGGRDLGAIGYGGTQEKDVVLASALALAQRLRDSGYEVHLIRDGDFFVPLWDRGVLATEWKGSRPGVFLSLHANSNPESRAVRGLETYFLAEARTEHERRLAVMENTSGGTETDDVTGPLPVGELPGILNELRNLDHQRWSARLAELVQQEMAAVHPGPVREVRQAPLAVITNALMPAVLVELGYVTNESEEALLGRRDFHTGTAEALLRAVDLFFEGYPPARAGLVDETRE
jgi:N-acetylmuramoyl-L-alanine amidase